MKKSLITVKLIQQLNGKYKIQVFDGMFLSKEEGNLDLKEAGKRIEQLKKEEEDAAAPGLDDVRSEESSDRQKSTGKSPDRTEIT